MITTTNKKEKKKEKRKKRRKKKKKCDQFRMQMNGGKVVIRPEADVGSELTSFDVTHRGLAAVKVHMF